MEIRIPKKFFYRDKGKKGYAYVKKDKLYVKGSVNFEHLMYSLTYSIRNYKYCPYCNEAELNKRNRTLDHMYPRAWGGISIPNNLLPCCKSCNRNKKDMTYIQYQHYQQQPTSTSKDIFYKNCIDENSFLLNNGVFVVDDSWTEMYNISKLLKYPFFDHLKDEKTNEIERYYESYKHYPYLLIVSGNGWVFRGKHILEHAKRHHITIVQAIILTNVIVLKGSS